MLIDWPGGGGLRKRGVLFTKCKLLLRTRMRCSNHSGRADRIPAEILKTHGGPVSTFAQERCRRHRDGRRAYINMWAIKWTGVGGGCSVTAVSG